MKDKMKLEEAIKILRKTVKSNKEVIKEAGKNGDINVMQLTADLDNQSIAIETVLQENEKCKNKNNRLIQKNIEYEKTLEKLQKDTVWKYKIEDKIKEVIKLIEEEQFKVIMGDTTICNRIKWILEKELLEE